MRKANRKETILSEILTYIHIFFTDNAIVDENCDAFFLISCAKRSLFLRRSCFLADSDQKKVDAIYGLCPLVDLTYKKTFAPKITVLGTF